MMKTCPTCGKHFETHYSKKIYCSSACQMSKKLNPPKEFLLFKCQGCGKFFRPSRVSQKYCSPECRREVGVSRQRAYAAQKRAEWIAAGMCGQCGKNPAPPHRICEECKRYERNRYNRQERVNLNGNNRKN